MSILKIEKGQRYTLSGMINYISDEATHNGDVLAEGGVYVSNDNPLIDMELVKMLHRKKGGLQYKQIILSLEDTESEEENYGVFIDIAEQSAKAIADIIGCQVVYAVHGNTDNLHVHFIVNSVRFSDGYKLQINRDTTSLMKNTISGILEQYGFSLVL